MLNLAGWLFEKLTNFMMMKNRWRFLLVVNILLLSTAGTCQQLSQVSFLDGANLSFFSVRTEQDVLIRISEDGKILEWGTEVLSDRYNYYAPKLQPFYARVEYFEQDSDSAYKGK